MNAKVNRIKKLADNFAVLLDQEQRACQAQIDALIESNRAIQGNTADVRFQRMAAQLKALRERFDLLAQMGRTDFLAKITCEAEQMSVNLASARAVEIMMALAGNRAHSLNCFCERVLDLLNEATGAERGFILFYLPESTQADVVAARNFQTRNLSLEEYSFSRTLLREVFARAEALLLEDASRDAEYSKETSVIKFNLKSILAAPLKHNGRTVGALYLENNARPCAFDQEDPQMVETIARFAILCLDQARLLPVTFEQDSSVFFDETKASQEIIGRDPKIIALLETINRLAESPATVLIEGESGTGKELVARALHYQGGRRERPFVAINCAAIPDNLLESELFGHEKGAFTGAAGRYIGRIEQGDNGTIFLDEVSELAYPLQAKLLRFLQSNELDRLGGNQTIRVNVRVVSATSKDLKALTEAGKFQEALYYRLNVVPVRMPSLRERKSDIPTLIDFFLAKFSGVYGKPARMEREVYERLTEYKFPGNVRELENLIHRLVALTDDVIRLGDLPREILQTFAHRVSLEADPLYRILETSPVDIEDLRRRKRDIKRTLAEQERKLIERVVQEAGGNLTEAAARLGLHRITLHKMLRRTKGLMTQ